MRSYLSASSSAAHNAFFTLTELTRPQTLSTNSPKQTSQADSLPVAARAARGEVTALQLPCQLGAPALVVVAGHHAAVAAALLGFERGGRVAALCHAGVEGLHDAKARAVAGGLRALSVVGDAPEHLRMPLGLPGAAHHAEAHHRL